MKILHIDTGKLWRGGQSQVLMLAEGLNRRADCENLILTKQGSDLAKRAETESVAYQELPFRFEADVLSARNLAKLIVSNDTILHAHTPHALSIAIMTRSLAGKLPICFTRRVTFPVKKFFVNRWKLNQADRLVAVSRSVAERLKESGVTAEKIRIIYSGVSVEKFPYHGPSLAKPFNLLIAGAVERAKGIDMALQFAELCSELPVRIHFAGGGPQLTRLQEIATRNSHLKVHGFVSEMSPLLHEMFAAISFSPTEGFPNFLLQAMSAGLPVLALENPATCELIQSNERSGFLFESADEATRCVRDLIQNREQAIQVGKTASRLVQSSFSSERMIDQTYQLYKEILP